MTLNKYFHRSPREYAAKMMTIISPLLKDEAYIRLFYRIVFHRKINLGNPQTYSEKLQWLKLHDKHPEFTQLVDKYESRKVVEKIVGEDYLVPLLGVWDSFDEIDFDKLPQQFVLKTNHDSQGVIVCKNKSTFDVKAARKKLTKCLRRNYYWNSREYPYKDVKRKIIAEQYIEDKQYGELRDYKFFCFNGKCEFFFIATGRAINDVKFDFFDRNLKSIPVKQGHPNSEVLPEIPSNINEMISVAEKLSQHYPQMRIDLYNVEGKIYCGEFTIFHFGGLVPFEPESYDEFFGSLIQLP